MKKLTTLIAILLCVSMLFAACGNGNAGTNSAPASSGDNTPTDSDTPAVPEKDTLNVALDEEPSGLDCTNKVTNAYTIMAAMYDSLLKYDLETGEIKPSVATEWEWIDDLHLRLYLREDVVAYDGTILTAHDVLYTFQKGTEGTNTAGWGSVDINECYVENDFTVVLGLKSVNPTILYKLCNTEVCSLIDESSIEANGSYENNLLNPRANTGRYFLESWESGGTIRLVRNDNYWDKDNMGYYKYINITFIPDPAARALAVQSGDADVAAHLSSAQMMTAGQGVKVDASPCLKPYMIFFNCSKAPFDDIRVREAFCLALNRGDLLNVATLGMGTANDGFFALNSDVYQSTGEIDMEATEEDIARAKQLLADAGYADGIEIPVNCVSSVVTLWEAIQNMVREAGFNLTINQLEVPAFITARTTGDYYMYSANMDATDPADQLKRLDARVDYSACMGGCMLADPEIYDVIDTAYTALDEAERIAAYQQVQDWAHENFIGYGLYDYLNFALINESLTCGHIMSGHVDFASMRPAA